MTDETVLKLRPEEQYAEYLADRIRLAYDYSDWYEMQYGEKPDSVSSELAQTILASVIAGKHS